MVSPVVAPVPRQIGDDLPHLSSPRDAVTVCDRLSNGGDGHGPGSIIEGTIDPGDMALLLMYPSEERANLLQSQGRDQAPGQIDMNLIGTTRGIRAELANPLYSSDLIQDRG